MVKWKNVMGVGILVVLGVFMVLVILTEPSIECINEFVVLDEQKFCDYCDGCFCFNGTRSGCTPIGCMRCVSVLGQIYNNGDPVHNNVPVEVYFQEEFDLKNWKKGDKLDIRWCNIPNIGWRIRGVSKV